MKKTVLLVCTVLLGSSFAGAAPRAPHGGFHHADAARADLPRGFEQLGLSEEQKAKIQAIVQADRPAPAVRDNRRQNQRQTFAERKKQERDLVESKQFDEAAARKMIEERRQARLADDRQRAERELQMLKKRHAIFQLLTPEQQRKLREMRERRGRKPQH